MAYHATFCTKAIKIWKVSVVAKLGIIRRPNQGKCWIPLFTFHFNIFLACVCTPCNWYFSYQFKLACLDLTYICDTSSFLPLQLFPVFLIKFWNTERLIFGKTNQKYSQDIPFSSVGFRAKQQMLRTQQPQTLNMFKSGTFIGPSVL